ncbi:hypothetical protein AGLY_013785 [Aphis glycines]|uniref:Uncharacterized protein n=1 Tax=Aphis glycines TaxID=307491 RepID=A0A6G0T533_APHGL|nr:hypothetical protein AGLY_013785 [Aphis glycines]
MVSSTLKKVPQRCRNNKLVQGSSNYGSWAEYSSQTNFNQPVALIICIFNSIDSWIKYTSWNFIRTTQRLNAGSDHPINITVYFINYRNSFHVILNDILVNQQLIVLNFNLGYQCPVVLTHDKNKNDCQSIVYEKVCITFSSILTLPKQFYRHSYKNNYTYTGEIFKISIFIVKRFRKNQNSDVYKLFSYNDVSRFLYSYLKENFLSYNNIKESFFFFFFFDNWFCIKMECFPLLFFVFLNFFENCKQFLTFDLYSSPRIFNCPSKTTSEVLLKHYFNKLC